MIDPPKPNQVAPMPEEEKKPGFLDKVWDGVKSGTKKAVDVKYLP